MRRDLALALVLALVTWFAFRGAEAHGFLAFDDADYVLDNPIVKDGLTAEGVRRAATEAHAANWHPLTWVSHMLDVELYGLDPAGHHRTNVWLHALNAALCFVALRALSLGAGASLLAAALFALHPLRVESVAWVAERKDVLSGTLWMLALLAHAWLARRPGVARLGLLALVFALGLAAKPTLVTLPFVLLLVDVWPLRRWRLPGAEEAETGFPARTPAALVFEKLPLFALAAGACLLTVGAQRAGGAVGGWEALPLGLRVENAAAAYGVYLAQTLWPTGLAAFYPHAALVAETPAAALLSGALLGTAAVVGIAALGWRVRREAPGVLIGWLWYLGTLVPTVGLVQVGSQAHADRYTYLPSMGLALALVSAGGALVRARPALARVLAGAAAVALLALGAQTRRQVEVWRDGKTLWEHALAVTEHNYVAHNNLGQELLERGEVEQATDRFRAALAIVPRFPEALTNLGVVHYQAGRIDRAAELFEAALRSAPGDSTLELNYGSVLLARGDLDGAEAAYLRALEADPAEPLVYYDLALVAEARGEDAEAERRYRDALALTPEDPDTLDNLGALLLRAGRVDEARGLFQRRVANDPESADARYNLGRALEAEGRTSDARAAYRASLARDPQHAPARARLDALEGGTR